MTYHHGDLHVGIHMEVQQHVHCPIVIYMTYHHGYLHVEIFQRHSAQQAWEFIDMRIISTVIYMTYYHGESHVETFGINGAQQ